MNGSAGNPEDYRFSVGKLPAWAKKQVEGQVGDKQNGQNKGVDFPKGQFRSIIYLSWYGDYNDTLQLCQWQSMAKLSKQGICPDLV